ncbi:rod shape-determining protein RodA [Methyloversatilis sp. RAC08]|uniref:rod shape-determining protein RodA n=1 Tax=Methyloversatilis sp. RAC08 TaxID=1842540 RepID=UPI00083E5651|nr:rod shape-determining protein RodA [Methyloversatilis sp. RAC08]AOF80516.1 rod shape-determining protein RodA [Methyloversatilis sp. RAC08]
MQLTANRWLWLRGTLSSVLGKLDLPLVIIAGTLLALATLVMASATADFGFRFDAHLVNLAVGLSVMLLVAQIPPLRLMQLALPFYLVGVVLLVGVELFGETSKGAQRWLDIGFTRIQPSEMLKISVPLMLAWYFHRHEAQLRVRDFLVALVILIIPVGLIFHQPDLGTAILVLAAGVFVIFFAGLSWKLIIPVLVIGVVAVTTVAVEGDALCAEGVKWPGFKDYQRQRVCTLLDPTADPRGSGFHIIQSSIAIGSGGVFGKGWKEGTQTHLEFVPERHTDFIFAVMAEEFGLLGCIVLLGIYILLIGRGLMIAASAPLLFSRLLAGAISLSCFTYAFVNMGMVTGVLPVVGVPLPFVSYGGTALVTLCIGLGLLMSIEAHRRSRRRDR